MKIALGGKTISWMEFFLRGGSSSDILVQRSFNSYMVKPYDKCDIDNDSPDALETALFNLIKNSMNQYKRELCLQRLSIINCNCIDPMFFSLFSDSDFCLNNDQIYCTDSIFGIKSILIV